MKPPAFTDVACPKCKAPIGYRCMRVGSKWALLKHQHSERVQVSLDLSRAAVHVAQALYDCFKEP